MDYCIEMDPWLQLEQNLKLIDPKIPAASHSLLSILKDAVMQDCSVISTLTTGVHLHMQAKSIVQFKGFVSSLTSELLEKEQYIAQVNQIVTQCNQTPLNMLQNCVANLTKYAPERFQSWAHDTFAFQRHATSPATPIIDTSSVQKTKRNMLKQIDTYERNTQVVTGILFCVTAALSAYQTYMLVDSTNKMLIDIVSVYPKKEEMLADIHTRLASAKIHSDECVAEKFSPADALAACVHLAQVAPLITQLAEWVINKITKTEKRKTQHKIQAVVNGLQAVINGVSAYGMVSALAQGLGWCATLLHAGSAVAHTNAVWDCNVVLRQLEILRVGVSESHNCCSTLARDLTTVVAANKLAN